MPTVRNRLMSRRPIVLVTAGVSVCGEEFEDASMTLSDKYAAALVEAGAIPLILAPTVDHDTIAESVRRSDGVMLTGGEDVEPRLYAGRMSKAVLKTVKTSPDAGARDYRELLVIHEVFQQKKPLLAICRGHQLLNVALGGSLIADLPSQRPEGLNHGRSERSGEPVHQVRLTEHSLIARIVGGQTLGVNSTHHQAVDRVASPLKATAVSTDGVVEGMELKPRVVQWLPFLLSLQFHPERLMDRYREHREIFLAFTRACGSPD
jgi:putative glutamine amidotransferase